MNHVNTENVLNVEFAGNPRDLVYDLPSAGFSHGVALYLQEYTWVGDEYGKEVMQIRRWPTYRLPRPEVRDPKRTSGDLVFSLRV